MLGGIINCGDGQSFRPLKDIFHILLNHLSVIWVAQENKLGEVVTGEFFEDVGEEGFVAYGKQIEDCFFGVGKQIVAVATNINYHLNFLHL